MATGKGRDLSEREPMYRDDVREGIRIAELLAEKYVTLRKLDKEISDREFAKKKCEAVPKSKRHLTPGVANGFAIGALLAFLFTAFVCGFIYLVIGVMDYRLLKRIVWIFPLIPIIVTACILAIGFDKDRKEREYLNSSMDREEKYRAERIETLEKEIRELREEREAVESHYSSFEVNVPEVMRTRGRMELVRQALVAGEAGSFPEAVKICMSKMGG